VRRRDAVELEAALVEAGLPCSRVNNFQEVFDDPHIVARGVVRDIEHPRLGRMKAVRNPVLLDRDGPNLRRHSPVLGEHSEELLRELGYSDAEIDGLVKSGVTRLAPRAASVAAE
jgi:formyl-CoA transferase